jgi:hypothetical protein
MRRKAAWMPETGGQIIVSMLTTSAPLPAVALRYPSVLHFADSAGDCHLLPSVI